MNVRRTLAERPNGYARLESFADGGYAMWLEAGDMGVRTASNRALNAPSAGTAETKNILLDLLDEVGEGGISLDFGGYVTAINATAHQLIGQDLVLTGGKLKIVGCPAVDVRLRALIAQLHEPSPAAPIPWVAVPREDRQPLFIRPVHLPSRSRDALAILRVSDLERTPGLVATPAAELFGLTPAELKVAEMLARGKDLSEIAAANKKAIGTVRSQIKAVFAKTGTRRQSELASLMVRIAVRTSTMGAMRASAVKERAFP